MQVIIKKPFTFKGHNYLQGEPIIEDSLAIEMFNAGYIEFKLPQPTQPIEFSTLDKVRLDTLWNAYLNGEITPPPETQATVVSVTSPTVNEGGTLVFTITLSSASLGQLIPFATSGTATAALDYTSPLTFNNNVSIIGANLSVPVGVTVFSATAVTVTDTFTEPSETVVLTVGGVSGIGTILNIEPAVILSPLNNVAVFEKSYEMMTGGERTASAAGGGYPVFAVSRNTDVSPSYQIHSSDTEFGVYSLDADNVPYTPSGLIQGTIGYEHQTLSVLDEINFPSSISANTVGLIADTEGQQEICILNSVQSITIGGETAKVLENVGVAAHYSVPIQVDSDETARLYVLTSYGQDTTLRANGDRWYKITPKNASGDILALSSITPIKITIASRRNAPNPPRLVKADSTDEGGTFAPSYLLSGTFIRFYVAPSSKVDETTPSSFFNPSGLNETGVEYKVDVEDLDGIGAVRTLTIDPLQSYTILYGTESRATDKARLSTKYTVYAEKAGVKSLPFSFNILQAPAIEKGTSSMTLTKIGSTVQATIGLNTPFSQTPIGNELVVILVRLSGTLIDNITFNSITATAPAEIVYATSIGEQFYVQTPVAQTSIVLSIPFTGGVGDSLTVQGGNDDLSDGATIVIS